MHSEHILKMDKRIKKACSHLMRNHNLTDAEHHILILLVLGHTPKEIAGIRKRSVDTVRTQIKHVLHKMQMSRVVNLISLVYEFSDDP